MSAVGVGAVAAGRSGATRAGGDARREPAVAVIGIGNELAGDDGVGLEVVRRIPSAARSQISVRELRGDLTELLTAWRGCHAAVLVDAMRSDASPGSVRRIEVGRDPLPAELCTPSSTHGFTLLDAIELARALHQMPSRVVLYAVEGRRFQVGAKMSRQVSAVLPDLADAVLREASRMARPRPTI